MLIGVDEATYASVSDFGGFLQHPENRKQLDFNLKADGYDDYDHTLVDSSKRKPRKQMQYAGWEHRRRKAAVRPEGCRPRRLARRQPVRPPRAGLFNRRDYWTSGNGF